MSIVGIDPLLFGDFVDESLDSIAPLDGLLVSLPEARFDDETVAAMFRPVHSLKGNAGFFRLMSLKRLAHSLENLLDALRKHEICPVPREILLEGFGEMAAILRRVRSGGAEVVDREIFDDLLRRVAESLPSETSILKPNAPPIAKAATPALEAIFAILDKPLTKPLPKAQADEVARLVRELENIPATDEARAAIAKCREAIDTILPVLGFDPVLRDLLLEALNTVRDGRHWAIPVAAPPTGNLWSPSSPPQLKVPAAEPPVLGAPHHESERSMRVAEKSIDGFLGYVGELVVVEEVFQHMLRNLGEELGSEGMLKRFRQNLDTFASLSRGLRESILELRRVPARQLLQKVPRLSHEAAARLGKQVRLEMEGEDIRLDKSHVDLLDAPLTHIVNNAMDHGLETPTQRIAAGKPAEGLLSVRLVEQESFLVMEIRDDGKGLDLPSIRAKAERLGLVNPSQVLDLRETAMLLFLPGVSTAATVSDISGRGVGMDVVRREIHAAGGRTEVESHPGQGTTFRLFLPHSVHTRIVEGFVVRVADGSFLFPLPLVGEVFPLRPDLVHEVPGRGEVIRHGDAILPLVSLSTLLTEIVATERAHSGTVVVVQVESVRLALLVDEVLGIRKTVIKPLGAVGGESDLYEGVGMMGDGSMSLILGSVGILRLAGERREFQG